MLGGESRQSSIEGFIVKGPQQEQFSNHFALYVITGETPFLRVNHQYLHKAIGILGALMPDEKVFRNRLLDELYTKTQKKMSEEMQAGLLACWLVCICVGKRSDDEIAR